MNSHEVSTTLEKGVRVIRINRPKTKNALDANVFITIANTLNEDAADDSIVVTIITGTGDYYSSGFDITSAASTFSSDHKSGLRLVERMVRAMITYPKLLIAVVNGPAIGLAVTTAVLCDIVYASDRATFETPFLRLGLCPEGASSHTFPRILGRSKASEMLFLGKRITAREAHQFGLVAEVIPHGRLADFMGELGQLGRKLSVNSVKITKKLMLLNYKDSLGQRSDVELQQLTECFMSEEFSEALIKFMSRKGKL